jgi:protein TonB
MKTLAIYILLSLPVCIFAQKNDNKIQCNADSAYFMVDTMPRFKGEGIKTFLTSVVQELHQSPIAFESKKRGEILIQFVICQAGFLIEPKIIAGIKSDINNEVLKILSSSPKWEPGWQDGRIVNVVFTERIPVNFKQIKKR